MQTDELHPVGDGQLERLLARSAARRLTVPRIALRQNEAAASLGMSVDAFAEHVAPELRCIRRGRMKLYPVAEIERWADRAAALSLPEALG